MKEDPKHKKKKKINSKLKKKYKKRRIILVISLLLLFIVGFAGFYVTNKLGKLNKDSSISASKEDLGIDKTTEDTLNSFSSSQEVMNIALFGLDQRTEDEPCRSDAIMVLSVDKAHKKLKLTSIMRDSYVSIDGHGKDKLNHAYAYGGPQLAIKTLNQNFKLNITDYVSINFFELEKLIDDLGGVVIDVKPAEVPFINDHMKEVAALTNTPVTPLKSSGSQNLNGRQALAYSRIRYQGNGDYERTDRQRRVLEAMMYKVLNSGVSQYPSLLDKLGPHVTTSLSNMEILSLGTSVVTSGTTNIEQVRFPYDGYFNDGGKMINDVWYLPYDLDETSNQIHEYIYNDILPKSK